LVINAHLDFIESGADVIVTNNFSARRKRMLDNEVDDQFNFANEKAGEIAQKAKQISKKNILIAGSLPAQNNTYISDDREKNLIKKDFFDQANLLNPFIDFFYLDVLSSIREVEIALNVVEKMNQKVLVGIHIKKDGKLPSGENITELFKQCKSKNWLGLIAACVSPEIIENTVDEVKDLGIPFGFKANLWKNEEPLPARNIIKVDQDDGFGSNPVDVLGSRSNFTGNKFCDFSERMVDKGATILGGCCETKPFHINAISKLKQI
jgi:homocysteine S-methyltransferase